MSARQQIAYVKGGQDYGPKPVCHQKKYEMTSVLHTFQFLVCHAD